MRLIQLNRNGNEADALDLHPMVTIVSGLSEPGRATLIRAVRSLPRGEDPGIGGLVEAHGLLLDLDVDTLAMLDCAIDADVVIGAADMPRRGGGDGAALEAVAPELTVEPLSPSRFLEVTPDGRYPELDAARRSRDDAHEAWEVLHAAVETAKAELAEATVRRLQLAAELDDLTSRRNRANLRLVTDEFVPGDAGPSVAERRAELEERRATLTDELERTAQGLAELSSLDVAPVRVLLEAIHNPGPVELVPSERGRELADEYEQIVAELATTEGAAEFQAALPAFEAAQAELAAAEKGVRPPEFTDQDREELEAAHEEVLEAERGRGRSAKRKLDEALAKEQAILDRIGFPTWSAYVMGAQLMGVDPAAEMRLEKARFEMERAQQEWERVAASLESNPTLAALLDRMDAVSIEALDLLKGQEPEDLAAALRDLQEEKREISLEELADALAYQLELLGLELPSTASIDVVIMAAEALLEEANAIAERVGELEAARIAQQEELANVDAELAGLPEVGQADDEAVEEAPLDEAETDARIAQLETELASAAEDETDWAELAEARAALVDAALQVEAVAVGRLKKLAAELAAAEAEADPMAALAAGDHAESAPEFDDVDDVDAAAQAVEFFLLARLSALRNLTYAGSVPLLLDDALAGLPADAVRHLLDRLERMSESVQVIYLSDDPVVAGWAEGVGFDRAAVVPAPAALG